jgi:cation transport ATPase
MTCASCMRRVERAQLSVAGVSVANVNLVTQRATVRSDPSLANVEGLALAVKTAGYDLAALGAPRRRARRLGTPSPVFKWRTSVAPGGHRVFVDCGLCNLR